MFVLIWKWHYDNLRGMDNFSGYINDVTFGISNDDKVSSAPIQALQLLQSTQKFATNFCNLIKFLFIIPMKVHNKALPFFETTKIS